MSLGIAIILIGIVVLAIGIFSQAKSGKAKVECGGIVFIGPVPIAGFATNKDMFYALMIVSAILIIAFLVWGETLKNRKMRRFTMAFKLFLMMNLTVLLLFGLLFGLLAAVGFYLNFSTITMVVIAIVLVFVQWLVGPSIIWMTTNMRPLEKKEYPWIWETVSGFCKKNKVPFPQKIALARSGAPNAFVFGRTPWSATLAVTQGLLNTLSKDEVKAVIAHELGHIKHRDMIVMTFASVIPLIAYYVALNILFSSGDRKSVGAAVLIGIGAYLVYIISNLLVLALSRYREYYADNFGGRIYKPSLLASALTKITYGLSGNKEASRDALRSFYIADPITSTFEVSHFSSEYSDLHVTNEEAKKAMEWEKKNVLIRIGELFRTHPLTFKRVRALMEMEKELR
ncbi:MAG: M48 family metalloprotease [Candidatus Aenigmarchaeota archaeon]|nr:M48 family metalloprotease [Candidatus Aenigmarchaeota archaeon]